MQGLSLCRYFSYYKTANIPLECSGGLHLKNTKICKYLYTGINLSSTEQILLNQTESDEKFQDLE